MSRLIDRENGVIATLSIKNPCAIVATSPVTLNGLQTIGGVVLADGDRVLVTAQVNAVENGIYEARQTCWNRAPDMDGVMDVVRGTLIRVIEPRTALWELVTVSPVVGTSTLLFREFFVSGLEPTSILTVEAFGAIPDPAVDNSEAFNDALDFAEITGDAVNVGGGVFGIGQSVIVRTNTSLRGAGAGATVLKALSTLNGPVIKSKNYDSLAGQNKFDVIDGVQEHFEVTGMRIDCEDQSSGNGISIYGKRFLLRELMVHDSPGTGIATECGDIGSNEVTLWQRMPESVIENIFIANCGGIGLRHRGPHDGRIDNLWVSSCAGRGLSVEYVADAYNGAADIGMCHIYANRQEGIYINTSCHIEYMQAENNTREGLVVESFEYLDCEHLMLFSNSRNTTDYPQGRLDVPNAQYGMIRIRDDYGGGGLDVGGSYSTIGNLVIDGNEKGGIGLECNASGLSVGGGVIRDYTQPGGTGVKSGSQPGLSYFDINLTVQNCETAWNHANITRRSTYAGRLFAGPGQTAFTGAGPSADQTEQWNLLSYDEDSAEHKFSKNKGVAVVGAASTSVVVTHGMISTPSASDIQVTPNQAWGSMNSFWVNSVNSSTFTINTNAPPGSDVQFSWSASI